MESHHHLENEKANVLKNCHLGGLLKEIHLNCDMSHFLFDMTIQGETSQCYSFKNKG